MEERITALRAHGATIVDPANPAIVTTDASRACCAWRPAGTDDAKAAMPIARRFSTDETRLQRVARVARRRAPVKTLTGSRVNARTIAGTLPYGAGAVGHSTRWISTRRARYRRPARICPLKASGSTRSCRLPSSSVSCSWRRGAAIAPTAGYRRDRALRHRPNAGMPSGFDAIPHLASPSRWRLPASRG